jgi:hypothetical protein
MITVDKYLDGQSKSTVEWINKRRESWMSDDQWLCCLFLNDLFNGFHHVPGTIKDHGTGIETNGRTCYFATFDYDYLTRAVIMAHDWGVRLEIAGSGAGMIKIILHKRHAREGRMCERHPTMVQQIEKYGVDYE